MLTAFYLSYHKVYKTATNAGDKKPPCVNGVIGRVGRGIVVY